MPYSRDRRASHPQFDPVSKTDMAQIVARIRADIDVQAERDRWNGLLDHAKAGEIGPQENEHGHPIR